MIIPIGSSCMGHRAAKVGDPVWDLATLFPAQGAWTERDYLALDTNRLIELTDGYLEVLPMPTLLHQLIVDPDQKQITVLSLADATKKYREHGIFKTGERATSVLFSGFSVAVDDVFSQSQT